MTPSQAIMKTRIVSSKSVSVFSNIGSLRRTVASFKDNDVKRTNSPVDLDRDKQGISDRRRFKKNFRCDSHNISRQISTDQRNPGQYLKTKEGHNHLLMCETFDKQFLLGSFQDPFKMFYRSFCKMSTTGETGDGDAAKQTWEYLIDYDKLTPVEVKIHEKHSDAVKKGKLMYIDPQTGYHVMSRLAHLERGNCCGNACRHCPYNQEGVEDPRKKKKFNTAFYV